MKHWFTILFSMLSVMLACIACQRRELRLPDNTVRLDLHVHDTLPSVGVVPSGEIYETRLYQLSSGELAEVAYTGREGGVIYAPAGAYQLVSFNFDTESVVFEGEESWFRLRAVSTRSSSSVNQLFRQLMQTAAVKSGAPFVDEEVVGEPGYLFAAQRTPVNLPYRGESDERFVVAADAWPLFMTGTVEVYGVRGLAHLSSATVFLTGMMRSRNLGAQSTAPASATLAVNLQTDLSQQRLETRFTTFGPTGHSPIMLYLLLTDAGGGRYLFPFDVSGQYDADAPELHFQVQLDFEIPEPAPGGGGMAPVVDDWQIVCHPVSL